jgi:hypothetical protein
MVDVIPPKGAPISVGTVRPNSFEGNGLGTQFYSERRVDIDWISKPRKL